MAPPTSPIPKMDENKMFQLKSKAINYYQSNGVPQKMESALNSMFFENPSDVYGYLCKYFEEACSAPTLTRITASKTLDTRGMPTLGIDVYCNYKNSEQKIASIIYPNHISTYDHAPVEERDAEDEERRLGLEAAISLIEEVLSRQVVSINEDPTDQRLIDTFLVEDLDRRQREAEEAQALLESSEEVQEAMKKEAGSKNSKPVVKSATKAKKGATKEVLIIPDAPREVLFRGCVAVGGLSIAICLAGAKASQQPLYEYVKKLTEQSQTRRLEELSAVIAVCVGDTSQQDLFKTPLPMVTILSSGRSLPGKQNCIKEFMVVPRHGLVPQKVVQDICAIYKSVSKTVSLKGGAINLFVNDIGALNTPLDRPEQGIDYILNALNTLELQDDYHLVLNVAAHEIFDYDKGKYEIVSGQQKTADELADFFADILARYPSIIGLIDPMRKVETEAWMKLSERVSPQCLILASKALSSPGAFLKDDLLSTFQISGGLLHCRSRNTVTELVDSAVKMRENGIQVVLSTEVADTTDNWIVELAFGLQADFIRVGAPSRGERISKLLCWQKTVETLSLSNQLAEAPDSFSFPILAIPVSPPPPEDPEHIGDEEPVDISGEHSLDQ